MSQAVKLGVPTPCFSTALSFYDGYRWGNSTLNMYHKLLGREPKSSSYMKSDIFFKRCKKLPANFIQAQRDYFGAHTYELLEKPGDLSCLFNFLLAILHFDKTRHNMLLQTFMHCHWKRASSVE